MIEIALFQPDIAPNAATMIRMAACLGLKLTIIEPAGFAWTDSSFRRAGMDYLERARVSRAASWQEFMAARRGARLVLLTTKAAIPYCSFSYRPGNILLLGQEGSGVPAHVHESVDARVVIPMKTGERSLNVALACAMVTGEALRQTGGWEQA